MKLFFIRHGQTDWNLEGKIQGSYNSELNEAGIIQSKELSKMVLKYGYKFSKIYASNLKRAIKTAQILSESTGIAYSTIKGLEEIRFGKWEGLSWNDVKLKFPKEYEEWCFNRRYVKPPEGESYQDMVERVLSVIDKIISENSTNVAIISHSGVIMGLQCYITNTPFSEIGKFKIDNTSLKEFDSSIFKKEIIKFRTVLNFNDEFIYKE